MSHKDSLEVIKVLDHFGKKYGDRVTMYRDKVHDYLGMDLDFSMVTTLRIGMIKSNKKIHEDFPEETKSATAIPATEHLFNI